MIDLKKLNYLDKIDINEEILIPKEYYQNTDICELKPLKVVGFITSEDSNYLVDLKLDGVMMLHDSITYDIIPYEFTVKIAETLENSAKTLDFKEFLWHYIVLEVPLRFTCNDGNYPENANYRVISEEEYQDKNNPFRDFSISE